VTKSWEQRLLHVQTNFSSFAKLDTWPTIVAGQVPAIVKNMSQAQDLTLKKIDSAVENRIKPLLVTSGRGKNEVKKIAAGGTLVEKIKSIGGGQSIRTPGELLWSPLYEGVDKRTFTDFVMEVSAYNFKKDEDFFTVLLIKKEVNGYKPSLREMSMLNLRSEIAEGAVTLIELIDDNYEKPAWIKHFDLEADR
jgi:hypothetical protein